MGKKTREIKELDHQIDCWSALENARANGAEKALVIMASGLGKTVMAIIDAKKFIEEHGGRVLCLCHRNDILDQLKREFEEVMEVLEGEYTFGMYNGNEKCATVNGEKVDFLFASFQTMSQEIVRENFALDEFTYIIVDEAHHAPAKTFYQVLKFFSPLFLLGMTATPDRKDKADLNVIFGDTVYEMRFPKAIAEKKLTEPRVRLLFDEVVELGEIYWKERRRKISASELNKRIFAEARDEKIVQLINEEIALSEIEHPRMVIFCRGVKHAENIASRIKGAVLFHSRKSEDGAEIDASSKKNLQLFRDGETDTIVVIDKLNEGIDVPDINVIVNLRQSGSRIITEQQLGRGLRLYPGKEFVLVLDFVKNVERLMMYWKLDAEVRDAKKVNPNNLRSGRGGGGGTGDVSGLDITTNDPNFQREDLDLMGVVGEIIAMTQPYTKEELIEQLQRKSEEMGKTPTCTDIDADPNMVSSMTYARYFGSYTEACRIAGLRPNDGYTKEELIAQLQKKAEELGRTPTCTDINADASITCSGVFIKVFGSYYEACRAAGLVPNENRTRDELIAQLQKKAEELGRTPLITEINDDPSMPSYEVFRQMFGSHEEACRAAGLKPNFHVWSKDELIDQIQTAVGRYGRVPTASEVDKDSLMAGTPAFIRVFGSWNGAVKASGYVVRRGAYSKEEIGQQILRLSMLLGGKTPTLDEIDEHSLIIVSSTRIKKSFGSYLAACEFVKLKPNVSGRTFRESN